MHAHRLIKIGIGNADPTVGAFRSNTDALIIQAFTMAKQGVTLGTFPEGAIPGYPAEDWVQWPQFIRGQWKELLRFAKYTSAFKHQPIYTLGVFVQHDGHIYNCLAVVWQGHILGIVPKQKLAAGSVFYDNRTFSAGQPGQDATVNSVPFGDLLFRFPFGTFAVNVCEDLWSNDGPIERQSYSGAELILNGSASPYRAGVVGTREELIATRSSENACTVVYTNQLGGNDGLVFDGGGYVAQNGKLIFRAPRWQSGISTTIIDLDTTTHLRSESNTWRADAHRYLESHPAVPVITAEEEPNRSMLRRPRAPRNNSVFLPSSRRLLSAKETYFLDARQAMKWGIKGYFEKTRAFDRIGIALSGGKDSALVLIAAWEYANEKFAHLPIRKRRAAIKDFIHCFSFPTQYNTSTTRSLSRQLAKQLGVTFTEIPIQSANQHQVRLTKRMLGQRKLTKNTLQNIQARIRMELMWNWSNSANGLVLQTGNMSELAVGYTTIGGDLQGAYAPIKNLPKTVVIALLHHLAKVYRWPVLTDLLRTKASAELAEGQEDERDLMPFPVLDACVKYFAGEKLGAFDLYQTVRALWTDSQLKRMDPSYQPGQLKVWVKKFLRLFLMSIYKWVQSPLGVHQGPIDLDRERALQLTIVTSPEWLEVDEIDTAA